MRVIAGSLRHRIIKECNLPTTRETQDRVREAIFNSLGFINGSVLDLFCGSGAMAIEAYSRGASYLVLNDINNKALKVAKENLNNLSIKDYVLTNMDYRDFILSYSKSFSYIFLDPPYKMDNVNQILDLIIDSKLVQKGTKIIFEMASLTTFSPSTKLKLLKEKNYGKKKVVFWEVF